MRAYEIRDSFGLDNLILTERPDLVPGPGQVVLKLAAASLNYRDLLMVQGMYNPKQPLPLVPLSDGVGRVIAVGAGVKRVKPGDRVMGIFAQDWLSGAPDRNKLRTTLGGPVDGMLAEQALLSEQGVVLAPEHLSDAEAATLPCAALTAWSALCEEGRLLPGETVLVQGTGGVSTFALQFAKMLSARVIVTSSSDEKLERAKQLGADATINYRTTPDWGKKALELTDGVGVDHIIEVGGASTLEQSILAAKFGGQINLIGILSGAQKDLSLTRIFMKKLRLQGILVGHREAFEAMNRAISSSKMRPSLHQVFPFEEAHQAFSTMAGETHFGKICIQIS